MGPSIFQDGLGTRWLALDADTGDPVEILSFAAPFVESPEFAAAVGERVARLARVRHTLYARVNGQVQYKVRGENGNNTVSVVLDNSPA